MPDTSTCPHLGICSTLQAHTHSHAVASYSGLAALRVFTINHRNTGLGSLQQLSIDADAASRLRAELAGRGIESIVLKTCNRTELYWRARVPDDDEVVGTVFADALGVGGATLRTVAIRLSGDAAATHLFRVCCGLESLVLGEAEILGQVRAALEACPDAGPFLEGVVRAALRTGRQARAETAIGTGAISLASAGVRWLADRLPLATGHVLVIGAGETGAKVARHLRSRGVGRLTVANRAVARAEALAASCGATATGLDALPRVLAEADAVVCAADSDGWLVTVRALEHAAPLLVVDLSMPSAIEPGETPGVTRIDLAGLEHLSREQHAKRMAEVPNVEAIIDRELQWLQAWARHQALRPLVSRLRRKVESIRQTELARAEQELMASGIEDATVLDRMSRRLLDQILAIPLAQLEAGDVPLDAAHAEYLRRLFSLTEETQAWT